VSGGRRGASRHRPEDAPQEVGSVLGELLKGRPWAAGLHLGQLGRRWTEVVGARVAMESRPTRLEHGNLVVEASSAAWAAQLTFLKGEIRSRANAVLGSDQVRELRVVVAARDA
jgi:predicted nucleic acid-binding Zn ribbon protein